jgi:PncC family amidohydrolase
MYRKEILGGFMETNAVPLEEKIAPLLREHDLKLVAAESCTGGLLSHRITNVSGSSDYYLGGIVSYSNQAKEYFLGVKHATLLQFGAVSRQTALEMALGVRRAFSHAAPLDSLVSLSITGIAGPSGGTAEKPVGTVWIGISSAGGEDAQHFLFSGSRMENKASSAQMAFEMLHGYLLKLDKK